MAQTSANVDVLTENFDSWVTKTNELRFALQNVIVTANSSLGNTVGNAFVQGTIASNTGAFSNIQGMSITGTSILSSNLNITSNVVVTNTGSVFFSNTAFYNAANSLHTNTSVFSGNLISNGVITQLGSNTLSIISNTSVVTGNNFTITNQNTTISSNIVLISNNYTVKANSAFNVYSLQFDGVNTFVFSNSTNYIYNSNNITFSGGLFTISSNTNLIGATANVNSSNLNITANTYTNASVIVIQANTQIFKSNSSITALTIFNSGATTNTIISGNNLNISASINAISYATFGAGLSTPTANVLSKVNVGTDVNITTTGIFIGNGAQISSVSQLSASLSNANFYGNTLVNGPITIVGNTTAQSDVTITGNTNVSSSINVPNINVANSLNIGSNINLIGSTITVGNSSVYTRITPQGFVGGGDLTFRTGTATLQLFVGSNVNITTSAFIVGNTTSNTVITQNTANFAGTLGVAQSITGQSNISAANFVTSNDILVSNGITANTVTVNGDLSLHSLTSRRATSITLGSNVSSPQLVFSFPKTQFSSSKFICKANQGVNTQISEILLAHNQSVSFSTVFGTVVSPASTNGASASLGLYSSLINGSNAELYFLQTSPATSLTIIADMVI